MTAGFIINNRVVVSVWCWWSGDMSMSSRERRILLYQILRKEVIQPQVPLRLPCYDLVPIKKSVFGA